MKLFTLIYLELIFFCQVEGGTLFARVRDKMMLTIWMTMMMTIIMTMMMMTMMMMPII